MRRLDTALIAAALLAVTACTTEETYEPTNAWEPERYLPLSSPCLDCIAAIGGGQCAGELDACEADEDCWFMFYSLDWCEGMSALWTPEEASACAQGAVYATGPSSRDRSCALYSCTWGLGNAPQEWLDCLHGGCDGEDNAIMSFVADWCSW